MSTLDTAEKSPTLMLPAMLARSGATYRQLDYWTSCGYLRVVDFRHHPGSGFRRAWVPGEDRVALVMHVLVQAGTKPEIAAEKARSLIETGQAEMAPGILLTMENFETVVAAVEWFEEDQW